LVVVAIAARYKGDRYRIEVIGHAVWLHHRFALTLRDVEELMLARGVVVTYETIRSWCAKFGPDYANQLRRRRPRPGDKWHLDEVFIKINGTTHYLWRAVDQYGDVLDILVQSASPSRPTPTPTKPLQSGGAGRRGTPCAASCLPPTCSPQIRCLRTDEQTGRMDRQPRQQRLLADPHSHTPSPASRGR
jgi:hypothetical protein